MILNLRRTKVLNSFYVPEDVKNVVDVIKGVRAISVVWMPLGMKQTLSILKRINSHSSRGSIEKRNTRVYLSTLKQFLWDIGQRKQQ